MPKLMCPKLVQQFQKQSVSTPDKPLYSIEIWIDIFPSSKYVATKLRQAE